MMARRIILRLCLPTRPAGCRFASSIHERPQGRSGASNVGARAASGGVLLFLDGDTVADPDLVNHHWLTHSSRQGLVGRGETFHCGARASP